MSNKIKFSIILPTYNVEKFITQALNSCINQTFKDIEIIVVDDCGQDKSIEIAKEFALKDERVKIVYNKENQGTFTARNNGVLTAKGEYLLFLDPDDYLDEKTCELIYQVCEDGFADMVRFGMFELCGEQSKILHQFKNASFSRTELYNHFLRNFSFRWNVCANAIKTEKYKQSLMYLDNLDTKITIAEDALQSFVLYSICENFININEVLYFYRTNLQSAMNNQELANIREIITNHELVIKEITRLKETYPEIFSPVLYKLFLYFLKREHFRHGNRLKKQEGKFNFMDRIKEKINKKAFKTSRFLASKLGVLWVK
ncbi:glycosyltransferase family 2 protein [Campylobacter sp. MIT 19-121]|uniref:glycosyltransferase family 2 protein n=1 Tax=Campylobacter sp. MIT 19-121 TaxID=2703906 RepID=UPI00138A09F4|nr:glycosyltransferase family 2 protein [Campylobacter sp. MIT 19-121]NDJ26779.1 glycosyltransferase family 2 protein [Campylobacter sp. MIT 19-121]